VILYFVLNKYSSNDQTKEKKLGETCDTYGENRNACKILLKNLKEGDCLKDIHVDGRIFNTMGWRGLD
jgi:hypothetical protein